MRDLLRLAVFIAVLGWSTLAYAQPSSTTGAVAPQQCTVAEVISDLCGPKLLGIRIAVVDGADATECGNLGDAGLGAFENLCRWSDIATAWVSDDVDGLSGSGPHPIAAGDYAAGSIAIADIDSAAKSGIDPDLITGTATVGECGEYDANGDLIGAGEQCAQIKQADVVIGPGTDVDIRLLFDQGTGSDPWLKWIDAAQEFLFSKKVAVFSDHIDAITEIRADLKTGIDGKVVTGTSTVGECGQFDANGDLIGAGAACGAGGGTHPIAAGDYAAGSIDDDDVNAAAAIASSKLAADVLVEGDVSAGLKVIAGALLTESADVDFISGGALTCGAGTAGAMKTKIGPLQYCDESATPVLRHAALANSAGQVTDFAQASDLDAAGDVVDGSHAHPVSNLSDTSATAAKLDSVTDGGNADVEHVHTDTGHPVLAGHIDAIEEIAAALKTGIDGKVVTGTATVGECGQFDANGDLIGAGAACGSGGGGDNVEIDGVAATDPDFRSDGDIDVIRCTAASTPDSSCVAVEDVLYRYKLGSISNADVQSGANINGTKVKEATQSERGTAQVASQVETDTGTNNSRMITPLRLNSRALSGDLGGTIGSPTVAGTHSGSAHHADESAASETTAGILETATIVEVDTGTDTGRAVSPGSLDGAAMTGDLGGTFGAATVNATHAGSAHHADEITATEGIPGVLDIATSIEIGFGTAGAHAITAANASSIPVGGDLTGTVSNATIVVGADHIDAIGEIAAALKTGDDGEIVTGTAGSTNDCAKWDVNGDLITSGAPCGGETLIDECPVVIETPQITDDPMCGKATSALTLKELCCTATGSTTPSSLIMTAYECHPNGHTCVSSGLTVTLNALVTSVCDAVATDDAVDDGDWFGIFTDSFGTTPDFVNCQLEFTR